MSPAPKKGGADGGTGAAQALSALEGALRQAVASAPRDQVVKAIAAKPTKGTTEPENQQPVRPIIIKKAKVTPDPIPQHAAVASGGEKKD